MTAAELSDGEKESPRKGRSHGGRRTGKSLGLLFLGSGRGLGGLGGLSLGHALLEFIDAAGGIDELLLTGIEGMAEVANADNNRGPGGAGLDDVAAGATNLRGLIFRVDVNFHNKGGRT